MGRLRLAEAILAWLGSRRGRKPVSVACELAVARQFYEYLQRAGHRGLRAPAWPQLPATSEYTPHIFSAREMQRLIRLTQELGGHPFRWILYRTLIVLHYCTGLRFGEALGLRIRDLDLATVTLFILDSKGRSRWVPYHRSPVCRHRSNQALRQHGLGDCAAIVEKGGAQVCYGSRGASAA